MRKLKGFTLVEILIVIVIIGILIGALVPRMQSAQGRARDVARKNDLSQLQSAILVSYQDKGRYPCSSSGCYSPANGCNTTGYGVSGVDINCMGDLLLSAGMNGVPQDPLKSNSFSGAGVSANKEGQYRYLLVNSYGTPKGSFVLMAKTEVEGGSNWVVSGSSVGQITSTDDVQSLKPCSSLQKNPAGTATNNKTGGACIYTNESQLRYVLIN